MHRNGRHFHLTLNFAHIYRTYIHSLKIRDTPRILLSQKYPELDKFSTWLKKENGTHLLQISHWENAIIIKSYNFFLWLWVSYKIWKENGIQLLQISHSENACTIKTKYYYTDFFIIKLLLTISNGNKLLLKDKWKKKNI